MRVVPFFKTTGMEEQKSEFKINGAELLEKIRSIIHEGNVRRIIIKDKDGKVFMEIPLTFGLAGAALLPLWAAIGALAALVNDFTIEVIRTGDTKDEKQS